MHLFDVEAGRLKKKSSIRENLKRFQQETDSIAENIWWSDLRRPISQLFIVSKEKHVSMIEEFTLFPG
jgi:hypothetical protein